MLTLHKEEEEEREGGRGGGEEEEEEEEEEEREGGRGRECRMGNYAGEGVCTHLVRNGSSDDSHVKLPSTTETASSFPIMIKSKSRNTES